MRGPTGYSSAPGPFTRMSPIASNAAERIHAAEPLAALAGSSPEPHFAVDVVPDGASTVRTVVKPVFDAVLPPSTSC